LFVIFVLFKFRIGIKIETTELGTYFHCPDAPSNQGLAMEEATDLRRWRLIVEEGRQVWRYIEEGQPEQSQQSLVEKYSLGLLTVRWLRKKHLMNLCFTPPFLLLCCPHASWWWQDDDVPPSKLATTPLEAAEKGVSFYQQIQSEDGHWAMDYGGPLFLMPG